MILSASVACIVGKVHQAVEKVEHLSCRMWILLFAAHVPGTRMQHRAGLLLTAPSRAVSRATGLCMGPPQLPRQSSNLWVSDAQLHRLCNLCFPTWLAKVRQGGAACLANGRVWSELMNHVNNVLPRLQAPGVPVTLGCKCGWDCNRTCLVTSADTVVIFVIVIATQMITKTAITIVVANVVEEAIVSVFPQAVLVGIRS